MGATAEPLITPEWVEQLIREAERQVARRGRPHPGFRVCVGCQETKDARRFEGDDRTCRACVRKLERAAAHRRQTHRAWRRANREKRRVVTLT